MSCESASYELAPDWACQFMLLSCPFLLFAGLDMAAYSASSVGSVDIEYG